MKTFFDKYVNIKTKTKPIDITGYNLNNSLTQH